MATLTLSSLVAFALALCPCASADGDLLPVPVRYETLPDGSIIASDPGFDYRPTGQTPRIVGGRDITDISQAPFMVLIKMKDSSGYFVGLCAGTILSEEWVLTASHCLRSYDKRDIVLLAGNVVNYCVEKVCHADKGTQFLGIDRIVYHTKSTYDPEYPKALTDYDIALVKVTPPLKLDGFKVAAMGLPSSDYPITFLEHGAYGWGITKWEWDSGLFKESSVLKEATIQIRPESTCTKLISKNVRYSPDIHFCAGGLGGNQPCVGDSGGPLVTRGRNPVILGVLNYGRVCGEKDHVSVYMNVWPVVSWIKRTVGFGKRGPGSNKFRSHHHGSGKNDKGPVKWSWDWDWDWED